MSQHPTKQDKPLAVLYLTNLRAGVVELLPLATPPQHQYRPPSRIYHLLRS